MNYKIILIIIFIFLVSCKKNDDTYKSYKYNELIKNETIQVISDSIDIFSMPNAFEVYKDSLVFFTDNSSHELYKYDLFTKEYIQLGRKGKGPGEYVAAFGLFINQNNIYYSDFNEPGIEYFDFNGQNPQKLKKDNIINKYSEKFFFDSTNKYYYFDEVARNCYYINSENNDSFMKAKEVFIKNPILRIPFSGYYLKNDIIYFMRLYEPTIYSVDLKNGKEKIINIPYNGFCNWDKMNNINLDTSYEVFKKYNLISSFFGFEVKNEMFFFIWITNAKEESNILICDSNGKIKFSIDPKGHQFKYHSVSNNKLYGYARNDDGLFVKIVEWNKKFYDLLEE